MIRYFFAFVIATSWAGPGLRATDAAQPTGTRDTLREANPIARPRSGRVTDALSGAGLAGVVVSDGATLAITDAAGRYALRSDRGRWFVIKPRGWRVVGAWWQTPTAAGPAGDFRLARQSEPEAFDALVLTDPQPATPREVDYLSRSLARPLAQAGAATRFQFVLTLGDVTYDRPDLYPSIDAVLRSLGLPVYSVPGNHDLTLGVAGEGAIAAYEQAEGPSTYAFHWGPALFVALDDVRHQGGPRYVGGLLPDQWTFLAALLKRTAHDTPLVLYFHIPLFAADPFAPPAFPRPQRDRLFAQLRPYRTVLLLSGHTHYQRRVRYGADDGWQGASPLTEENVAAACGGYWGGPLDASGVPVSTMSDGTPPGYAVLSVSRAALSTTYHRRPDLGPDNASAAQISLHAPRVLAPRQGYVPYYANVFDGDPAWTVSGRVDERGWLPLRPAMAWDPTYATAFLAQDTAALPTATPRLPDPTLCFHLWRAFLPADLAIGEHRLQVRAIAPDGRTCVAETRFRIADSPRRPPP